MANVVAPAALALPRCASQRRERAARRRGVSVVAQAAAAQQAAAADAGAFPRGGDWEVHKFGGTCVGSSERIRAAAKLMIELPVRQKMVVVSAMGAPSKNEAKVRPPAASRSELSVRSSARCVNAQRPRRLGSRPAPTPPPH